MPTWATLRAAVHDLEPDERSWVAGVLAEARELFDSGLGTFVYTYRIEPEQRIRLGAIAGQHTGLAFWQELGSWGARNAATLASVYRTGVSSLSETAREAERRGLPLSTTPEFATHGVGDLLTMAGHDRRGTGVFVTVPRARAVSLTSREQRALERLAFDLLAASRLREHRREARRARLSGSEELVLRLLAGGASDKTIASELGVSLSTVSTFVRRARHKLGCLPGGEALALSSPASASTARRLELLARLTPAECDVASALLVGASYADIARQREVSERTIAAQCAAIFRKCHISGRRALAAALLG